MKKTECKKDEGFLYRCKKCEGTDLQVPMFYVEKGVEKNSINCTKYDNWVHKRCFRIRGSITKTKQHARVCWTKI